MDYEDEEFAEQCRRAEEYVKKKKEPKVNKKGGIFDSANYELEKKKKHQESEGSDKEKEEEKK
jgi:hypothetical protein